MVFNMPAGSIEVVPIWLHSFNYKKNFSCRQVQRDTVECTYAVTVAVTVIVVRNIFKLNFNTKLHCFIELRIKIYVAIELTAYIYTAHACGIINYAQVRTFKKKCSLV